MEIDKIRHQFESHLQKFYPSLPLEIKHGAFRVHPNEQMGDVSSEYKESGVQLMWIMFLAGANYVQQNTYVLLPELKNKPQNFYDTGYNEGVMDSQKKLKLAGFKIRK